MTMFRCCCRLSRCCRRVPRVLKSAVSSGPTARMRADVSVAVEKFAAGSHALARRSPYAGASTCTCRYPVLHSCPHFTPTLSQVNTHLMKLAVLFYYIFLPNYIGVCLELLLPLSAKSNLIFGLHVYFSSHLPLLFSGFSPAISQ